MPIMPAITWPDFLSFAPYFQAAIGSETMENVVEVAPLPRAAYYYNLFDGEVSNGGVIQYFFNLACFTPGFAQVPDFVAESPVLAPALPYLREAHAAWSSVAPAVEKARMEDEWPEELFQNHRERFAALERSFFEVNHGIAQRLAADIVMRPHEYFTIEPLADVPKKGVAHVSLSGGSRLRFENGFPIGPNLLEQRNGDCDVVWFSRDRTLMTSENSYAGRRSRSWIHYPTQRSSEWTVMEDGRQSSNAKLAFWADHGLTESFRPDGSPESATFSMQGQRVWAETGLDRNGRPRMRIEYRPEGERALCFWPGGAVNAEWVSEAQAGWRQRFLRCLDAEGRDIAPGGTGRLYQVFDDHHGRRQWREGRLVDGYLEGVVVWMSSAADGTDIRENSRATFRCGVEE